MWYKHHFNISRTAATICGWRGRPKCPAPGSVRVVAPSRSCHSLEFEAWSGVYLSSSDSRTTSDAPWPSMRRRAAPVSIARAPRLNRRPGIDHGEPGRHAEDAPSRRLASRDAATGDWCRTIAGSRRSGPQARPVCRRRLVHAPFEIPHPRVDTRRGRRRRPALRPARGTKTSRGDRRTRGRR